MKEVSSLEQTVLKVPDRVGTLCDPGVNYYLENVSHGGSPLFYGSFQS